MDKNQINQRESGILLAELAKLLRCDIKGDVVEFGCYEGGTSILLARLLTSTNKRLFVYDSFTGLPEKSIVDESPLGMGFRQGELAVSKKQFIKNIKQAGVPMPVVIKGWFADLSDNVVPNEICFAFLDGDYYQSIRDSLKLIEKKMSKNSTIVVDDYANDLLPGVALAVDEWLALHRNATKRIEKSLAIINFK